MKAWRVARGDTEKVLQRQNNTATGTSRPGGSALEDGAPNTWMLCTYQRQPSQRTSTLMHLSPLCARVPSSHLATTWSHLRLSTAQQNMQNPPLTSPSTSYCSFIQHSKCKCLLPSRGTISALSRIRHSPHLFCLIVSSCHNSGWKGCVCWCLSFLFFFPMKIALLFCRFQNKLKIF